jgi:hypothetical protein
MAKIRKSTLAFGAGLGALLGYFLVIRPWSFHWGAAPAEVRKRFPGDELVPSPMRQTTRSITINAPASAIWPWLVQMGFGRASWYTYQFLEKFMRLSGDLGLLNPDYYQRYKAQWKPNADRILPEYQHLEVGDSIADGPDADAFFNVTHLEPEKALVLYSERHIITGIPPDLDSPNPGPYTVFSWGFYLQEIDARSTRLIIRVRANYAPRLLLAPLIYLIAEPADFIYNYGLLHGIKQRVEAKRMGDRP